MNLDRYDVSYERRKLSGLIVQRGFKSGFSLAGSFLFGSVFVGIGIMIILIGTRSISVDPKTVHAPYWVVTVCGIVFAAAGLAVWCLGWREHSLKQRSRHAARNYPEECAYQDYPWNPEGAVPPRWKPAIQAATGTIFLAIFLSMFNWWAFVANGPFMVKLIVVIFDLLLVYAIYQTALRIGRSFKFGGSALWFDTFPFRVSQQMTVRWKAGTGIVRATKGTFTLRCVEEYWVNTGSGKNRSRKLVHEQIWSGTWHMESPHAFSRNEEIELRYDIPPGLPSTHLSGTPTIFWEVEIRLELPGLDFEERYLVPVYTPVVSSSETPNF